jgi:hypothetical protein
MYDLAEVRQGACFLFFETQDEKALKEINIRIRSDNRIKSWWNRMSGLYIIETFEEPLPILQIMQDDFKPFRFIGAPLAGEYVGNLLLDEWKHLFNIDPDTLRRLEISVAKQELDRQAK